MMHQRLLHASNRQRSAAVGLIAMEDMLCQSKPRIVPATPATQQSEGYLREVETRCLRVLDEHESLAAELWRGTEGCSSAYLGRRRSLWSRWRSGRLLSRRVDEMAGEIADELADQMADQMTEAQIGLIHPRRQVSSLCDLGRELVALLDLGPAEAEVLRRPDMTRATEDFIRQARADDPDLRAEDLGQALRNVWVIHYFMLLQTGAVRHSQASLGYSLLYPYTDNVLDDPRQTMEQKRVRSQRLGLRLAGIELPPLDESEARVFQQLDRIDSEFSRCRVPELHMALLAIHRSQVASLRQQGTERLDEDELLRLSVAKGGSSVLVDSYLVDGRPTPEMARFAFVYGVALQLADDLQDVESDLAAGHQTLFTLASERGRLEREVWRLVRFLDASLELRPPRAGQHTGDADLGALARASMVHLMIQAVGAQPRVFPRALRRRLGRYSPVTFGQARRLRRKLARLLSVSF